MGREGVEEEVSLSARVTIMTTTCLCEEMASYVCFIYHVASIPIKHSVMVIRVQKTRNMGSQLLGGGPQARWDQGEDSGRDPHYCQWHPQLAFVPKVPAPGVRGTLWPSSTGLLGE